MFFTKYVFIPKQGVKVRICCSYNSLTLFYSSKDFIA